MCKPAAMACPDLQPEKARIATLGFVFEPAKWLSVSADWWFVYRRNEIAAPDYSKPEEIIAQTRFPITDARPRQPCRTGGDVRGSG